jgi:hypothetical protein
MLDELEIAYLAGVIDSDGYITIKAARYHTQNPRWNPSYQEIIGLKQVSPIVPDMLYDEFGGYRGIGKSYSKGAQVQHIWQVTCAKAEYCAKILLPYLRIKRRQAEILLKLRETKQLAYRAPHHSIDPDEMEFRQLLLEEIRSLNDSRFPTGGKYALLM